MNYSDDNISIKKFAFAIKFNQPVFQENTIKLGNNNMEINFSTGDFSFGIDLYNAFLEQKNKSFSLPNDNKMVLKRVQLNNHNNITSKSVNIKMLSPLVVRCHEKDLVDKYLIYSDEKFDNRLFEIVRYELKELCDIEVKESEFKLTPINPKKTVVYAMGIRFSCSIGLFNLTAIPEVINLLYQYGMGSRRSAGFGMFDII